MPTWVKISNNIKAWTHVQSNILLPALREYGVIRDINIMNGRSAEILFANINEAEIFVEHCTYHDQGPEKFPCLVHGERIGAYICHRRRRISFKNILASLYLICIVSLF